MNEVTPETMQDAIEHYAEKVTSLKTETESAVVKWRVAETQMVGWEPFFDELDRDWNRWNLKKENWLEKEPDGYFSMEHGLDAQGRVRLIRTMQSHKRCIRELYFIYGDDVIDAIAVSLPEGGVERLKRYVLAEDKTDAIYEMDSGLFTHEEAIVENGRYERSIVRRSGQYEDSPSWGFPSCQIHYYEYDAEGRVKCVVTKTRDENEIVLERFPVFVRPPGTTKIAAAKRLEDLLVKTIPDAVKEAELAEPSYALMICYCGEDMLSSYSGFLVMAPKSVRDSFVADYDAPDDDRLLVYTWAPDELRNREETVELDSCSTDSDEFELREAALVLMELCDEGDHQLDVETLVTPLRRAARRLNQLDWSEIAPITDDFVVTALDNTGEGEFDTRTDISASVPQEKLKRLQSRGLLWPGLGPER